MTGMFYDTSDFNGNLSGWDVSSVTNMTYMFSDAASFNQTLSSWDVSSVTNMSYMFSSATSFNQTSLQLGCLLSHRHVRHVLQCAL